MFVLLAEDLPPSLATVASRCVHDRLHRRLGGTVAAWLVDEGVDEERADCGGRGLGRPPRPGPAAGRGPGLRRAPAAMALGAPAASTAPARRRPRGRRPARRSTDEALGSAARAARRRAGRAWRSRPRRPGHGRRRAAAAARGAPPSGGAPLADRRAAVRAGRPGRRLPGPAGGRRWPRPPPADDPARSPGWPRQRRAARHVRAVEECSAALDRNAQEALLMEALMVELSDMLD